MLKNLNKIIIILLFLLIFYEKIDYKIHNYVIDNIYLKDTNNRLNYLGFVEIDRLNIRREIVYGINDFNLLNHVTLSEKSKSLKSDNIILAGHAIKNIFLNLKDIKINDEIKIISDKVRYYEVYDILIVNKANVGVIDNSDLILITCKNNDERIIVKANKKR